MAGGSNKRRRRRSRRRSLSPSCDNDEEEDVVGLPHNAKVQKSEETSIPDQEEEVHQQKQQRRYSTTTRSLLFSNGSSPQQQQYNSGHATTNLQLPASSSQTTTRSSSGGEDRSSRSSAATGGSSAAKSNLFATTTNSAETAASGGSSILAPATRYPCGGFPDGDNNNFSSNDGNATTDPNASVLPRTAKNGGGKSSSSLFGAVMKHIQKPPPQQNSNHRSLFSTPNRRIAAPPNANIAANNSGYRLQDLMEGFSPVVVGKTNHASSSTPASAGGTPSSSAAAAISSTPRRNVDWHPGRLVTTSISNLVLLDLVDWSLKTELELECQPEVWNSDGETDDGGGGGAALQQFLRLGSHFLSSATKRHDDDENSSSSSTTPLLQFQASLQYWQHPAVYPVPPELRYRHHHGRNIMNRAASSAINHQHNNKLEYATDAPSKLSGGVFADDNNNNSKHPSSSFSAGGTGLRRSHVFSALTVNDKAAATGSTSISFASQRGRDWQVAFRSLYQNWIQTVRQLSVDWDDNDNNDNNKNRVVWEKMIDCYFYARGQSHTILFRVGLLLDQQEGKHHLVPEIVLSSSTLELRHKLRSMGVTLRLLESLHGNNSSSDDNNEEFSEDLLTRPVTEEVDAASPGLKQELVALRRAQVAGQTVGADVSVSIKQRAASAGGRRWMSPRQIPPLFIRGTDDCAAFAEVYLNSRGQIAPLVDNDVPLLLCRKLGPFLNASIHTVPVVKKKKHGSHKGSVIDSYSSLHLKGFLLPCAVRELIGASVSAMIADEALKTRQKPDYPGTPQKAENGNVGSHHLLVQAVTDEGEDHAPPTVVGAAGTIGSHSSKGFNAQTDLWKHCDATGVGMHYCHYDEMLLYAVWDISKPQSLAYKLARMSSRLRG